MKKIIYIALIALGFGCETAIQPELKEAEEILVIDAWLTQKMERQKVMVSRSQPYFDNSYPSLTPGAQVTVEDLNTGVVYNFQEGADAYYWDPADAPLGEVGHTYKLAVTHGGETFEALSTLGRVPEVDTILYKYNSKDFNILESYYSAEFVAVDLVGPGDAYWIKAWKNGNYLGKPSEINIAFDAGLSPSQSVDGEVFHQVIRRDFVNPLDPLPDRKNYYHPPYQIGDSLYVEIHSIDPVAFEYLTGVILQTNRPGGFSELFATPLANVMTNVSSTDENSNTSVAGFFNMSAVSSGGGRITQEIADEAKADAGK
jgi:hypothetical protein